jgi:hypothetical protein
MLHASRRGRGFIHRPEKYHRFGAAHPAPLVGAAAAFAIAASMVAFKKVKLNQGESDSCPGAGSSQAISVRLRAIGTPLAFEPSPKNIYANVRAKEQPGTGPLEDSGADPVDLVDTLGSEGVEAMPTNPDGSLKLTPDGRIYDLWSADDVASVPNAPAPNIGDRPTAKDDEASQADLVLGIARLDPAAADFEDQVCSAIDVEKAPVGVGIHATPAFEAYGDAWTADAKPFADATGFTDADGHWVAVYAYRTEADGPRSYWLGNSWGDWGDADGGVWVTGAWLRASCMVALKFACTLKAAA